LSEIADTDANSKLAGGVGFTNRRDIEITDADKIPKEYWIVDEVMVRKDALAGKQIPGVKRIVKKIVNVRLK